MADCTRALLIPLAHPIKNKPAQTPRPMETKTTALRTGFRHMFRHAMRSKEVPAVIILGIPLGP
jgi:hypothetical protein